MIIIKPKMLEGQVNVDNKNKALFAAGLVLGALGCRIDIRLSPDIVIDDSNKYLLKILKKSGCIIRRTKYSYTVVRTGLTNPIFVDASKCAENIFFVVVLLCFLSGNNKLTNLNCVNGSAKEKLFSLIGSLKGMGADITVNSNEILLFGKQALNGSEVTAYGNFDIFSALCIVAHRCEGSLAIKSAAEGEEYSTFKNMLISLGAEIVERNSVLKMKKNIVLTGMSGAGKSHVGKELADKLGFKFYDSDAEFEKEEQRIISDVFKEDGEEYFRKRESEVIKKLSRKGGCVISTGGGAVLKEENVANLKENGIIFYLERDIETIANTVDGSGRPLFKGGKASIKKLFKERKEIYEKTADYAVSNDGQPEDAIEKICEIYEEVVK